MFDIIISNGIIVTGSDIFKADIGIKDEKIVSISSSIDKNEAKKVFELDGEKYIFPGTIDVHTHMQLPFCGTVSSDDFTTGTKAGACGGVTTIIDFTIQSNNTLMESILSRREEADNKVCIDYSLHASITKWNENIKNEIKEVIDYGIPTFKMFMAYRKEGRLSDDFALFSALSEASKYGGMIGVHAENDSLTESLTENLINQGKIGCEYFPQSRPVYTEEEAILRIIKWAEHTGGNLYIFHMSSGLGTDAVEAGKIRGVKVYAETAMTYLLLNDEKFKQKDGHLYATCPPIRKVEDNCRLWQGLKEGSIQVLATDHCAFTRKQKDMWEGNFTKIPYGIPSIEINAPLFFSEGVNNGDISLNQFVNITSVNPAKLFGMYPEKGSLNIGTDADIVIYDPNKEVTLKTENLHMNVDYCPFEGKRVKGYPILTICRGNVLFDGKDYIGGDFKGKFIKRGKVLRI